MNTMTMTVFVLTIFGIITLVTYVLVSRIDLVMLKNHFRGKERKKHFVKLILRCPETGLLYPHIYYARDCEEVIEVAKRGNKVCLMCPICGKEHCYTLRGKEVIGGTCSL